jgi:glucan biosynthesis protein C
VFRAFNDFVFEVPLSHTPFAFIVKSSLVYFPFFFLGMLLYAVPWLLALFERMHWIHLVVGVVLVVAARMGFDALPKLVAETFKLTSEAYLAVCVTSSLFCLFRRIVPAERPVARYLSDAAYTVYLFHYLTIYVLAWALRPLLGDDQLMYAAVVVGTAVITLLIYHYPVSRIRILGILFNGKLPVGKPKTRTARLDLGTASAD